MTVARTFLAGFLIAMALVPLCRMLAFRTGMVARPRHDRWHRGTIPLLGGIAIGGAMFLGALITGVGREIAVPLTAAMFMFLVGLVDDVLALKPSTKLVAQIAAAATLLYFGYQLNWLESRLLDSVLTMVWVIGLTNAFNLLDNMDGLCAGTAFIVAVMLMASLASGAAAERAGPEITFLALLAGAAAGFLVYNFPPASIFMGDSGSLLLGFSLAMLTLGSEGVRGSRSDVLSAIAAPVFVLLIPIFDTTLVTVARLMSGRSPAMGGRDHSSHRLVAMGLSERSAVFVLWSLAGIGGLVGLLLRQVTDGRSMIVGALFLTAMCLFAIRLARVHVYDDTAVAGATFITPLSTEFMFKRRVVEVVLDVGLIGLSYYAVNQWYFEPEDYLRNADNFYRSLPIVIASQLAAFFVAGFYRAGWQYAGLRDARRLGRGVVGGAVLAQLSIVVVYQYFPHAAVLLAMDAVMLGALVVASRAALHAAGWRVAPAEPSEPA